MGNRVILAVTNDLTGDQRVHKVAMSLLKWGYKPMLVGRKLPFSKKLNREYPCVRLRIPFRKGPQFYFFYNLQLLFYLLFKKSNLLISNDLDTLPAVYLASRIKRTRMLYDSHEYYTEVPELVGRPAVKKVWEKLEGLIFPKLKTVCTVNTSIANIYHEKYGVDVKVIRNLPPANRPDPQPGNLPDFLLSKPLLIYQGAVNIGRGLEQMVEAMSQLPEFGLIIAGDGDIRGNLQARIEKLGLDGRIWLPGMVPFENLAWFTRQAVLGLSIEQDIGLNYHYALPNKLFDYMQAGVPVLASDLPEIRRVVEEAGFGRIIDHFEPSYLASVIREMVSERSQMEEWKNNALAAFGRYTWETQEPLLRNLIEGDE
jgi:glycosyltransferase involved in cell wall biosynthesis